jgi:hypothetical protein
MVSPDDGSNLESRLYAEADVFLGDVVWNEVVL